MLIPTAEQSGPSRCYGLLQPNGIFTEEKKTMTASTRKFASVALAAIGLSVGLAGVAKANVVLPVTNLEFNQFTGTFSAPKTQFNTAAPTGWSIGSGGNLIGVGNQGSETSSAGVYAVYAGTGFSNTVPAGTNFFQADGNPIFESTIFQTIHGLTAGTTYDLQFQQAAGQQTGFTGATTEQWKVFLGVGGIGTNCGPNPCTVSGTNNNIEHDSTLMNTASQGITDWNNVTMSFTPQASNFLGNGDIVLTFLAWGNGGSTINEPPTVFLEGVNTPPVLPEPATLSVLGIGLLGLGGIKLRRRGKRNVAA
jgi:hypothetical protein